MHHSALLQVASTGTTRTRGNNMCVPCRLQLPISVQSCTRAMQKTCTYNLANKQMYGPCRPQLLRRHAVAHAALATAVNMARTFVCSPVVGWYVHVFRIARVQLRTDIGNCGRRASHDQLEAHRVDAHSPSPHVDRPAPSRPSSRWPAPCRLSARQSQRCGFSVRANASRASCQELIYLWARPSLFSAGPAPAERLRVLPCSPCDCVSSQSLLPRGPFVLRAGAGFITGLAFGFATGLAAAWVAGLFSGQISRCVAKFDSGSDSELIAGFAAGPVAYVFFERVGGRPVWQTGNEGAGVTCLIVREIGFDGSPARLTGRSSFHRAEAMEQQHHIHCAIAFSSFALT